MVKLRPAKNKNFDFKRDSFSFLQRAFQIFNFICLIFKLQILDAVHSDTLTNYLTDFNEQNKSLIIDIYWKSL